MIHLILRFQLEQQLLVDGRPMPVRQQLRLRILLSATRQADAISLADHSEVPQ